MTLSKTLSALRAIAEETRLRLLLLLARGEMTVGELVDCVGQSQPRVSRHLRLLVNAGLLSRFQEGTLVFYRLAQDGTAAWLISALLDRRDTLRHSEDEARRTRILAERKARADAYFSAHATTWNEERSHYSDEHEVEAALLAMAVPLDGLRLLDIGTGTGRILQQFGRYTAQAIGIDRSREMLAVARAALDADGLAQCSLRLGDMADTGLEAAQFDRVTIHQVLHYADAPGPAIDEAARLLAPGGRLLIADFLPHDLESLRRDHAHRRLGFSNTEMTSLAQAAGLTRHDFQTLAGRDITVGLWCFKKSSERPA